MSVLLAGSSSILPIAAAQASTSRIGTLRPFTPSCTESAKPPTSDTTTPRPRSQASKTTVGSGSCQMDGTTEKAQRLHMAS